MFVPMYLNIFQMRVTLISCILRFFVFRCARVVSISQSSIRIDSLGDGGVVKSVLLSTVALVASCCRHAGPGAVPPTPSDRGLHAIAATCEGADVAWTPAGMRDVSRLLSVGVADEFGVSSLGLKGFPLADKEMVVVIDPTVALELLPGFHRAATVPPPRPGTDYWKLIIKGRYTDGAVVEREQGSVREDGFTSKAIVVVCLAYVDGEPVIQQLWGIAG